MNEILKEIESQIRQIESNTRKSNVGTIVSVADNVARVNGLSDAMYNEMIAFEGGVYGIALNLAEDEVSCILLGDASKIKENQQAHTTGKLLSVPVGMGLLGRVVNVLGQPIDGKGKIEFTQTYPVEKIAPGILPRKSVDQPLQTGILAVDALLPIGRGQRELIIGDRGTGKTSIAIDAIINQARINDEGKASGDENFRPVYSIYVAVGQKNAKIARIVQLLEEKDALKYTIIVAASAAENASDVYIAPYAGCAMGEWFMDNGMDALIVYDDLSKHAAAYRQISLVLKRPSGREAYPGDVFYLHSRLLERSARLNEENGNGSLTALPIIETQAGDISAYIPTNVISITDGQIFLETDLFNQGVRPAIAIGVSVSRVGSAAQIKALKQVSGGLKGDYSQYKELAAFAQFGSDLDARTKEIIANGDRLVEVLKQNNNSPLSAPMEVVILFAFKNKFFAKVPVKRVREAVEHMRDYFQARFANLLRDISSKKALDEKLEGQLKSACEEWSKSFK